MKKYVVKRDKSSLPERLTRYRQELNEEQFRAVTSKPQAALVVAGAGTGKTRVITYRVAYLLEQGVSPQKILLATFTNRAAREMLKRVELLTGTQNVHRVWGGTFHRIANLILRKHAVSIGFDSNYSILDAEDARDFTSVCIEEAGIDTRSKRFPKPQVVQNIISYASNTDQPIEDVIVRKYPYFEMLTQQIKRVDTIYMERKRERNVMDYDDLLLNWKRLLVEKPAIAELYAEQFQYILVDEYQDTNKLQAEIIDLLAVKYRNVMVVGDDAQSIFAWRGAEFKNIYEFPERYPEAETFKLETNYRSTPEILGLANVSIANNRRQFPKVLQAVKKSREFKPALIPCADVEQQSVFIAGRILELRDEGVSLEDIGVLYRSHYHSLELQLELTRRNIPYRVQSGVRFFEQAHIKDVISYLRIIVNPRDELAWKRILKMIPGVGNVTANNIYEAIAYKDNPFALIKSEPPAVAGGLTSPSEIKSEPPAVAGGSPSPSEVLIKSEPPAVAGGSPSPSEIKSEPPAVAGGLTSPSEIKSEPPAVAGGSPSPSEIKSEPPAVAGGLTSPSEIKSEPPAVAGGLTSPSEVSEKKPQPSATADGSDIGRFVRNKSAWRDFVKLLEDLTTDNTRNQPGKQIEIVLSGGYEQNLHETYENAEARIEDLKQLAIYAARYDSTEDFLSELALISTERFGSAQAIVGEDVIMGGEEDELLTLTSIHQAKGLEWTAVFLIWAAEGKFPSPRSLKETDSEEERRLWYVALTRAKDELYLTYPQMIVDYSRQTVLQKPSRFIMELPPAMFEMWSLEDETPDFDAPLVFGDDVDKEFLN